MNRKTTRTLKRMLALIVAVATMLTLLVLPASAKSAQGFQYYVDGPYSDDDEAIAIITGHRSAVNGTLTVPAKLGGYEVWSISSGAFAGRNDITKVVLPDELGSVGEHAFEDCVNLRTLVVGDAYIGNYAFSGCKSLKTVRITAFKGEFDPEWNWMTDGNDALFAADQVWTHYTKSYDTVQTELKTRTGKTLTLQAELGELKKGERYRWGSDDLYPAGDEGWKDCTGDTVKCVVYISGELNVTCEVVNSKGNVVRAQEFIIHSRESLADKTRDAVYSSYLYGVTEYTVNHFRWRVTDMLDKMGIDVYGD